MPRPSAAVRALLLLASLGAGGAIGAVGLALTQDATWFLAVPASVAIGWWLLADPTRCQR